MGGVVSDVVSGVGDVLGSDLGKAALIAGGAYFGAPYLMGGEAAATGGGILEGLGTATGADLAAAYDMGAVGSAGAGGFTPVAAAPSLLGGIADWASQNKLQALGLGAGALGLAGGLGNKPTSSTTTTSIDPEMKAAYLRNLQEARGVAGNLGQRQFAEFPEYNLGMVQNYMNPYQQEVINASLGDIERQRQMQQLRDRAAATQAKAFGGSRQGVAEALTNEAFDRTAANTVANLRSQGFTQAQNLALAQEELKRQYQQQKLDAARNLGLERLNVAQGALSLQPANIGGTSTTPIYRNTSASALGGALSGGMLGRMIGGTANPEYAGYGTLLGGGLGLLG